MCCAKINAGNTSTDANHYDIYCDEKISFYFTGFYYFCDQALHNGITIMIFTDIGRILNMSNTEICVATIDANKFGRNCFHHGNNHN